MTHFRGGTAQRADAGTARSPGRRATGDGVSPVDSRDHGRRAPLLPPRKTTHPPKDSCLFESGAAGPNAMNPRILYLGSQQSFDEHTARMLVRWLYATQGNRALWVNSGGRGLIVVHPKAEA